MPTMQNPFIYFPLRFFYLSGLSLFLLFESNQKEKDFKKVQGYSKVEDLHTMSSKANSENTRHSGEANPGLLILYYALKSHVNFRKQASSIPGFKLSSAITRSGADVINQLQNTVSTPLWNKTKSLDVASHVTSFIQPECIISG